MSRAFRASFGSANDRYNRFSRYVGAGLVYNGPFQGRNADRMGLAVASALNGDAHEAAHMRLPSAVGGGR